MLYLYFCDDDETSGTLFCRLAQKGLLLRDWQIKLGGFFVTPEELLENLPSDGDSGLYFLDIELTASMSGFDLAEKIRQKDPKSFLVFISSHQELALDVFKYRLEAMDFIVKSSSQKEIQERIFACIQTAYERYTALNVKDSEILTLKIGKTIQFLPCSRILYIANSSVPHHIVVYTNEEMLDYAGTLVEIWKQHSDIFLKCSRSLLVNKWHVKELSLFKKEILLDNGTTLPCSFRSLAELRKMLGKPFS